MKQSRINLIRQAEQAGGVFMAILPAILAALLLFGLVSSAQAHDEDRVQERIDDGRYICYTPDELINLIDVVMHSKHINSNIARAVMVHDLVMIYKICNRR